MAGNWIEKCCPSCGKYFIDNSRNLIRVACSPKCRYEFYNTKNPNKFFERKINMRVSILRSKGAILTDNDINKIRTGLINGVCEICGRGVAMNKLNIDHDHKTNRYRGILCDNCNLALGYVNDDTEILKALSDYLQK